MMILSSVFDNVPSQKVRANHACKYNSMAINAVKL